MKRLLPVLAVLAGCVSEPVEKPIVDLDRLGGPRVRAVPAPFAPGDAFKRLYAAPNGSRDAWRAALEAARENDRRQMRDEKVPSVHHRSDLAWTRAAFVEAPAFVHDRHLYDPAIRRYTVGRFLDDLDSRYGGADVVVLGAAYPNLGVDERNQFDFLRDLPGGLSALRSAVEVFHRRGVHVMLAFEPWDLGTRDEGAVPERALARVRKETGIDGVVAGLSVAPTRQLAAGAGAVEAEAGFGDSLEALLWTPFSWADWRPYGFEPGVDRYRWVDPRFLAHAGAREEHDRLNAFQYAWFNGAGVLAWENVAGGWNALTARDAEILRRMALVYRALPAFPKSPKWEPYAPILTPGEVFGSAWPLPDSGTVWTFVNRGEHAFDGPLLEVPDYRGQHFYDLWTGRELFPQEKLINRATRVANLSLAIEPHGFGAVIETNEPPTPGSPLDELLPKLRARAKRVPSVNSLSPEWRAAPQRFMAITPTRKTEKAPAGMIRVPGAKKWRFRVEGTAFDELPESDLQYPWETAPHRKHEALVDIGPFYLDRTPVTNRAFEKFVRERDFHPADPHNFLRNWPDGKLTADLADKPVTWVSIEEARLFCAASGKRLPHEWEWQYAAQGVDGRAYPWGSEWSEDHVPRVDRSRDRRAGPEAGSFPAAASPFGALDMVGLVWQWTDEVFDEHTRAAVLKGGSYYQPEGRAYFPNPQRVDRHAKYLLMDPSLDRAGTIGFRCAADAP